MQRGQSAENVHERLVTDFYFTSEGSWCSGQSKSWSKYFEFPLIFSENYINLNLSGYNCMHLKPSYPEIFRVTNFCLSLPNFQLSGMPCEFVTNFDAKYPVILGGLLPSEDNMGFLQVSVNTKDIMEWFLNSFHPEVMWNKRRMFSSRHQRMTNLKFKNMALCDLFSGSL